MNKYPRSLYRLLRSIDLSPYYIERISVCDNLYLHPTRCNQFRILCVQTELHRLGNYNKKV